MTVHRRLNASHITDSHYSDSEYKILFLFKIGEQWKSEKNACISFVCTLKGDQILEKRTNIKQCDTKCKQVYTITPF